MLSLGAALAGGPAPRDACALVSVEDVARIRAATFKEVRPTFKESQGLSVSTCFYSADPFAKSVSVEVVSSRDPAAVLARWKKMFHERRDLDGDDDSREPRKSPPEMPVPSLGEEAFWEPSPATGALHVLANGVSVRVSVGGPEPQAEKLATCRALAAKVLAALKPPS
jgi:hypothetical protein